MKEFSLEEYLKNPNRKIVTRDGRNVRIICTDKKGTEYSVIALCTMSNGSENCYFYFPNGRMYLSVDSCMDLFFAPEKHEGWINIYKDGDKYFPGDARFYMTEKESKANSVKNGHYDYVGTVKVEWED